MRKTQPATEFSTVLAVVNVLALIYPFDLLLSGRQRRSALFREFFTDRLGVSAGIG